MEMIQTNFKTSLIKGEIAERYVKKFIESKGWCCYQPTTNGAHCFDLLAIKNKSIAIALDVKAKSRRKCYKDTGINISHYLTYKNFSEKHNIQFWIIFVDELEQTIYGNDINILDIPYKGDKFLYPHIENSIRFWHLDSMKQIAILSNEEAEELKKYNQRNY